LKDGAMARGARRIEACGSRRSSSRARGPAPLAPARRPGRRPAARPTFPPFDPTSPTPAPRNVQPRCPAPAEQLAPPCHTPAQLAMATMQLQSRLSGVSCNRSLVRARARAPGHARAPRQSPLTIASHAAPPARFRPASRPCPSPPPGPLPWRSGRPRRQQVRTAARPPATPAASTGPLTAPAAPARRVHQLLVVQEADAAAGAAARRCRADPGRR
jgi:hypothetical protein